jgi:general stress protein 26
MNIFPETDVSSLDPKDRKQIISMARELLKGGNPGILSTVDQSGFPHSRWMATMSFDDFPDLYKLTEKEAAEYVEGTDRVRKRYVHRYFGVDVADPHHYHLVINSGKVGYQEAARIIVDAASRQCESR